MSDSELPGVIEVVPAFTTVAVQFDPMAFDPANGSPTVQLTGSIQEALAAPLPVTGGSGRVIEIPACYGGEFGPDLEEVANHCGLSINDVIELHSETPLTLYAFFFSPGNPFAGPLDPRLKIGRRTSPRTRVEAGSVAIANGISSIYQSASPGGWNVIARTPWNLFDTNKTPPTRLQVGDQLKFKPISAEEFGKAPGAAAMNTLYCRAARRVDDLAGSGALWPPTVRRFGQRAHGRMVPPTPQMRWLGTLLMRLFLSAR